jgi:hypothetical protein
MMIYKGRSTMQITSTLCKASSFDISFVILVERFHIAGELIARTSLGQNEYRLG